MNVDFFCLCWIEDEDPDILGQDVATPEASEDEGGITMPKIEIKDVVQMEVDNDDRDRRKKKKRRKMMDEARINASWNSCLILKSF